MNLIQEVIRSISRHHWPRTGSERVQHWSSTATALLRHCNGTATALQRHCYGTATALLRHCNGTASTEVLQHWSTCSTGRSLLDQVSMNFKEISHVCFARACSNMGAGYDFLKNDRCCNWLYIHPAHGMFKGFGHAPDQ